MQPVCTNRQAHFKYFLDEKFEAGMVLLGPEVKSLREGRANLKDSYAVFKYGVLYLMNCHISAYQHARVELVNPEREKKLLMHKLELRRLQGKMQEKGYALIPTKIYFNSKGKAKVEIALARGKKQYDKREDIKLREHQRDMQRVLKKGR